MFKNIFTLKEYQILKVRFSKKKHVHHGTPFLHIPSNAICMLMRILNHKHDTIYVCKKEIKDRVNF